MGVGLACFVVMGDPMEDIAELVLDDLEELVPDRGWSPEHCDELLEKTDELYKRIYKMINERRIDALSELEI